jgi:hypothetical protein
MKANFVSIFFVWEMDSLIFSIMQHHFSSNNILRITFIYQSGLKVVEVRLALHTFTIIILPLPVYIPEIYSII